MSKLRNEIDAAYDPAHRFGTFGSVIERLRIRGFRGHVSTSIEFTHPVVAFSGANGSGKSTILELAACCYKNTAGDTYHVSDFFPMGELDRAPFTKDASVEVAYCQKASNPDKKPQLLTITRSGTESRWRGYDHRPEKPVLFVGHGRHLPRSERSDALRAMAESCTLTGRTELPKIVLEQASAILSTEYRTLNEAVLSRERVGATALVAERTGVNSAYSELHMGCGEARVLSLALALETAPQGCLVLLEEPESAVHYAAQGQLGRYFLEVALRKKHQILLTTHSEHLLRTLPTASRMFLQPSPDGIVVLPGLTSAQAASLMSDGYDSSITILVEDECAKHILMHLLARYDQSLHQTARIVVGGYVDRSKHLIGSGKDGIRNAMKTLGTAKIRVAAVLDGNENDDPSTFVFKLPGKRCPEEEMFASSAVHAMWKERHGLDVPAYLATLRGVEYHQWFAHLVRRLRLDATFLLGETAQAYVEGLSGSEPESLVKQLKEAVSRA